MSSSILKKHAFNLKSIYDNSAKLDVISIGRVEAIDDESDAGRIIVSIKGIDDKKTDEEKKLTMAFPLLPKHLQVTPKVGEAVFVLKLNLKDTNYIDRYYIGPIISQPQKLKMDPFFFTAKSALATGSVEVEEAPSFKPEARGVFPDKSYISIQGRDNSDIIFKNGEVLIRAGQHKSKNILEFNNENIGYFQLKFDVPLNLTKETTQGKKYTVANIVADKIHLITHGGTKNFKLTDPSDLITIDEMSRIANEAHPLPYGDVIVKFMEASIKFMINHFHPYSGLKASAPQPIYNDLANFDLSSVNSKNIKLD